MKHYFQVDDASEEWVLRVVFPGSFVQCTCSLKLTATVAVARSGIVWFCGVHATSLAPREAAKLLQSSGLDVDMYRI